MHERFQIKAGESPGAEHVEPNVLWEIIFKSFYMKSLCEVTIDAADESIPLMGLVVGKFDSL